MYIVSHLSSRMSSVIYRPHSPGSQSIPSDALLLGHQGKDAVSDLYLGRSYSKWGCIPSKVGMETNGSILSWFPYGDREYRTDKFDWVCADKELLVASLVDGTTVPSNAICSGNQNDGEGLLYSAVAVMKEGYNIPGKAKNGTCWYPYDGKEKYCSSGFYYICLETKLKADSGASSWLKKRSDLGNGWVHASQFPLVQPKSENPIFSSGAV